MDIGSMLEKKQDLQETPGPQKTSRERERRLEKPQGDLRTNMHLLVQFLSAQCDNSWRREIS